MKRILFFLLLLPFGLWAQNYQPYNNYDFVPGSKIIFEDDFRGGQDGEFPPLWKLDGGQAVVNRKEEDMVLAITKYYTTISPNIKIPAGSKNRSYMPAEYTIEFDAWLDASYDDNRGIYLQFKSGSEEVATINTQSSQINCFYPGNHLSGDIPKEYFRENFHDRWHHFAIAVKGAQIKVYMNQYRVLVVPDKNCTPTSIAMGGDASEGKPMLFKNFRFAEGGGMNMLGKKFTEAKIITHGINFDYNKATIKPESMGTLNGIVQLMKENPELKFEVGGHTDGDGDAAYNMTLSQQRAEAVKKQLEAMGVDGARLTAKGYGKTRPVASNTTPEGKANNRRVEFVKF